MIAQTHSFGQTPRNEMIDAFRAVVPDGEKYVADLSPEDALLVLGAVENARVGQFGDRARLMVRELVGVICGGKSTRAGFLCLRLQLVQFVGLVEILAAEAEFGEFAPPASLRISLLSTIAIEEI